MEAVFHDFLLLLVWAHECLKSLRYWAIQSAYEFSSFRTDLLPLASIWLPRFASGLFSPMNRKLTKRLVEAMRIPSGAREAFAWDTELPGFGIRILPSGIRTFLIQYRPTNSRRTRRYKIGRFGPLTVDQARSKARAELARVATQGADPSAERGTARAAMTVNDLAARYLRLHAVPKLKPEGAKDEERKLNAYVLPEIGRHKVIDVTRADVTKLIQGMSDTPIRANRTLAMLSKVFNLAERWGFRPDGTNPCRHVERYREKKRERFLSVAELAELGKVLRSVEAEAVEWPTVVPFLRMLLLTGCRRDEIRMLRWENVDEESALLHLPDSKTGTRAIVLNAPARALLQSVPRRDGNPYVFFGRKEGQPLVNVKDPWIRIRKRAKLDDVRLHDLRHTFASHAVSGGLPLPIIGGLLGHTQAATTQRYAHLQHDPLREASERVGSGIAAAMADSNSGSHLDINSGANQQ